MTSTALNLVPPSEDVLSDAEFDELRELIYGTFGVALDDTKRSLIVGRLYAVLRREGMSQFSEYISRVRRDPTGKLLSELVNRISTNHTFFNRESTHFDFFSRTALREVMQARQRRRSRDLRVWCAATSYGHEAYMLVMLMRQVLGTEYAAWDAGLLATDINDEVLAVAKKGVYPAREAEEIPETLRNRYFSRQADGSFAAKPELRREITFRRFNLMNVTLPFRQPFDIIFCRNVMIYFDVDTKASLATRMYHFTQPGGYLFIGAAESLPIDRTPYKKVSPGIYQRARG
ncbi:MAG: protein-glutamate O-methyltransferase CheR [Myxococcales bacterium FL481]|nr:MAG: protein-glutamate O-methyltransferase CheR [Myxococcales bacterium FL481]